MLISKISKLKLNVTTQTTKKHGKDSILKIFMYFCAVDEKITTSH